MQAKQANLLQFLDGTKQFIIPIYQRPYSWKQEQCQQLWDDIVRTSNDSRTNGHFIGSVVYIQQGVGHATGVQKWMVIDGQQRLTTISLLLTALSKVLREAQTELDIGGSTMNSKKLENYYLFNRDEDGEQHYKLLLTRSDRKTLISLLNGGDLPDLYSPRIKENYDFFLKQVSDTRTNLKAIYRGISRLLIVDVALEQDRDDPQLIFDSLNSTGLDLTQADRIRNYVLMGLEAREQARLYEDYWRKMEQRFGHTEYATQFDRFMRDYLTLKTGQIPNLGNIYVSFKAYVQELGVPIEEIVGDLYRYAKYFTRMAFKKDHNDPILRAMADINALKVEVAYPFLLEVYDDYEQKKLLSKDEFEEILRLVESYVFRRTISTLPTNSLNKTFASLSREITKEKGKYLESFKATFLLKESSLRFPMDAEFKAQFVIRDIYNSPRRSYILRKLENYGFLESTNIEDYTIEHIVPQNPNLSAEWQQTLGANWKETQAKYLHTIGNLTLTGYNSHLSDRPFLEKRDLKDGGFAVSPVRLNQGLKLLTTWNEDEIIKRAEQLAERAVTIWPVPNLPDQKLNSYRSNAGANADNPYSQYQHAYYLQGEVKRLFEQLRQRVLALDPSVREEVKKRYIAYKTSTNFLDVVPQNERLRLSLNMRFDEINDPKGLCRDVSKLGRWGNGDIEVRFSSLNQLDDIMELVVQSFKKYGSYNLTMKMN